MPPSEHTTAAYSASNPHNAAFIVYINGLEVPAKSVSLRHGVWSPPEMQIEMVADPVLTRLGAEDRVQVAVFYLDDVKVNPSVTPQFRLFGEGEITGWGYRNTAGGRSIIFSVHNQIEIFSKLYVHFMTTVDDMSATLTSGDSSTTQNVASSTLIYPTVLFNQGVLPRKDGATIKRPFDFIYNVVRGMMDAAIPKETRTVPASNFFTRWARLTNFHNRFVGCPAYDEAEAENIFPVLQAAQTVASINTIATDLLGQIQNAGSFWDMFNIVYQTMLMEVAAIPGMPLVDVDLKTALVKPTNFNEHRLVQLKSNPRKYGPAVAYKAQTPKRLQNYFPKPQFLFGIPPSCNVIFPSQLLSIAYEENYATQPTRLYFNDEVIPDTLKLVRNGTTQVIQNALMVAWPPEADLLQRGHNQTNPKFNGKNFLIYPEEFFKGPVMDRRKVPSWLFFLKQHEKKAAVEKAVKTAIDKAAEYLKKAGVKAPGDNTSVPTQKTGADNPAGKDLPKPVTGSEKPSPSKDPGALIGATRFSTGKEDADGNPVFLASGDKVEKLRRVVENVIRDTGKSYIPTDFALAWIENESNGKSFDIDGKAVGLFQLNEYEFEHLEYFKKFKASLNTPGISTRAAALELAKNDYAMIECWTEYCTNSMHAADEYNVSLLHWDPNGGDYWRLVKLVRHALPRFMEDAYPDITAALGRPPVDWEELYKEFKKTKWVSVNKSQYTRALNISTATGSPLPGASGYVVSAEYPKGHQFFAGKKPAPRPPYLASDPYRTTNKYANYKVDRTILDRYLAYNPDVYRLYAKYEFYRERYARRTGSATIAWNPYVVPGFPGMIFDQRASRVDLMVYINSVQQSMSHTGQRTTSISFMYGRQLEEMFQLLSDEFKEDATVARATAPQEPIRTVASVIQSFDKAEEYYRKLFYGSQSLYGKSASFDYREIVGFQSPDPDKPYKISIDGPDDQLIGEYATYATAVTGMQKVKLDIDTDIASKKAQLEQLDATIADSKGSKTDPAAADQNWSVYADPNTYTPYIYEQAKKQREQVQEALNDLTKKSDQANETLAGLVNQAEDIHSYANTSVVAHNLDLVNTNPVVPLPESVKYFENYQDAMKYNWRPICTLDEYVIFYNEIAEGRVNEFGTSRSVGAHYYDRIRTLTAPPPNYTPPPNIDGIEAVNGQVDGLNYENFPQTRDDWNQALDLYRFNLINKAPRT